MLKKFFAPLVLFYLRFFAKIQLFKINPIIIGVGGASGKTSTALLISKILSEKYRVKEGKGKNSETGIPLSILDIEMGNYSVINWLEAIILCPIKIITNWEKYDYYVVEMGIDGPKPPKNMEYLLKIVKPKIGLLTNINLEHSLNFDPLVKSEETNERKKEILGLTREQEGFLLKSISENGFSIVNLDDANIAALLPLKSKAITVSQKDKNADFYISDVRSTTAEFTFSFTFLNEKYQISVPNPLPNYFSYSFVFAIASAFLCKISVDEAIGSILKNFEMPPGRFSVFSGIRNTLIIDSSYNSSLEPAKGAIELVSEIARGRRKVGILGDMREMGSLGKAQHEMLAKAIVRNLDFVILIGPLMCSFVAPILTKEKFSFEAYEAFNDAKDKIIDFVKKEDLILVKGSQNTLFLERVVELLLLDKSDRDKLCRRGKYWDNIRRKSK